MQKSSTHHQKGSAHGAVVAIVAVVIVGMVGYLIWNTATKNNGDNDATVGAQETSETRDQLRKDHAITLATRLFTYRYINKQIPELSQAGYEAFSLQNDQEPLNDPLTRRPYVFSAQQSEMSVGQLTFGLNSSCDNKISGSDGDGLIIDTNMRSVALAIKLEAGGYACESSL